MAAPASDGLDLLGTYVPLCNRTFPGTAPNFGFEVTAATTVVLMDVRLKRSC